MGEGDEHDPQYKVALDDEEVQNADGTKEPKVVQVSWKQVKYIIIAIKPLASWNRVRRLGGPPAFDSLEAARGKYLRGHPDPVSIWCCAPASGPLGGRYC